MEWLRELISNPFLMAGLSSWLIAQVSKTVIHFAVTKKFDIHRIFGDGGMPSGHSATVTAVAIMSALVYGPGSFQFAISSILAIIVCHDAMGVRRETGKQTAVINEIIKTFGILNSEELIDVKLKEFVGHTPVQVFAGTIIGTLNALFIYFVVI